MSKSLIIRLFLILFIIFFAYLSTSLKDDIGWTKPSGGICHEYKENLECLRGTGIQEVSILGLIFDFETCLIIWFITILGSWYKSGNIISKLERASHLAKDSGELVAALGAIIIFTAPFNEVMLSKAFGIVFLGYFWGHLSAIILITIANYLKSKNDFIPVKE